MKKVYLAHSISTKGEFEDSKRVAERIRELGYNVYAAAENNSINDKSNQPTPIDIYNGDVDEIINSDIFVVNISGGLQDGTISEVGLVAGWNEGAHADAFKMTSRVKPIIAYTSNARLAQPQFYKGIPSAGANHLVLGMIDKWGNFVDTEENMIEELKKRV
ncbi:nucleoside 2-deoxyribosyltransferase [Oceanobacillus sp. FSL H7-0719]|uniref:nucleoside 2-deoxyribosyltransferase n=1 Tax=Oceanobacillus sp. FSL H7-0719 TaxID=2954507 RepID=UPI00325441FE